MRDSLKRCADMTSQPVSSVMESQCCIPVSLFRRGKCVCCGGCWGERVDGRWLWAFFPPLFPPLPSSQWTTSSFHAPRSLGEIDTFFARAIILPWAVAVFRPAPFFCQQGRNSQLTTLQAPQESVTSCGLQTWWIHLFRKTELALISSYGVRRGMGMRYLGSLGEGAKNFLGTT